VFCSGNFSASLPEAETWGGVDEQRGESMTMFTSSSPSSSSLSGVVLNSRSRFGGTALKGGDSLGTAKGGASAAARLLSSLPSSSESPCFVGETAARWRR